MTSPTPTLTACPFCGKTDTLILTTAEELANEGEDDPAPWEHSPSWAVICDASKPRGPGGCGAQGGFMPAEAEAIAAWNRRSPTAPPDTLKQALEARQPTEMAAQAIYESWSSQPGWVPWVEGGNSQKQDEARRAALPGLGLARSFHDTYERLAPQYGYATREDTREFDPLSPNGRLMVAVCASLQASLAAPPDTTGRVDAGAEVEKHPDFRTWTWDVWVSGGRWRAEYGWEKPAGNVNSLRPLFTRPGAAPASPAPAANEAPSSNELVLRDALEWARPYVERASAQYYDGTNGQGIREEAARRLAIIDAALSSTSDGSEASPAPAGQSSTSREFIEWADDFCNRLGHAPTPWDAWQEARAVVARPSEPCPRGRLQQPEPTCTNRHQCWEPCGELGKSADHARAYRGLDAAKAAGQSEPSLNDFPELEVGLPCNVKVGATTFRKGVKLRTLVEAARRWHREAFPDFYALTKEDKAENLARLQGLAAAPAVVQGDGPSKRQAMDLLAAAAFLEGDGDGGYTSMPVVEAQRIAQTLRGMAGGQAVPGVGGDAHAEALRGLRNLKVLLGTDAPEVRGWAPAVQQAAQRAVNTAIRALNAAAPPSAHEVQPAPAALGDGGAP